MKAIVRALADAARQLEPHSDTARLDCELLMAEAISTSESGRGTSTPGPT